MSWFVSMRSMIPVAFDSETPSSSASRLIVIAPWCWRSHRTCSWLMLTWLWSKRLIEAQRSSPIQPPTSVRMPSTVASVAASFVGYAASGPETGCADLAFRPAGEPFGPGILRMT